MTLADEKEGYPWISMENDGKPSTLPVCLGQAITKELFLLVIQASECARGFQLKILGPRKTRGNHGKNPWIGWKLHGFIKES